MIGDGWRRFLLWRAMHGTWLFWVLVLPAVARQALRRIRISAAHAKRLRGGSEEIPRLRYACGEIDKDEYERRRGGLRGLRKSA